MKRDCNCLISLQLKMLRRIQRVDSRNLPNPAAAEPFEMKTFIRRAVAIKSISVKSPKTAFAICNFWIKWKFFRR